MKIVILVLFLVLAVAGCRDTPAVAAAQGNGSFTPDSTRARELSEFRSGMAETAELSGGVPSLDSLGRAVAMAMMASDTARLTALTLSKAEFAWIYYPTNAQARPPYDVAPVTLWMMVDLGSRKGLGRATERVSGKALTYQGLTCDAQPSVEGENRVYGPCSMRLTDARGTVSEGRILSKVIERHGQWKVVSFANNLD